MNKQDRYKNTAFFVRVHGYDWIRETYQLEPEWYCKANGYEYSNNLKGVAWMIKIASKNSELYKEYKLNKEFVEFDLKELIKHLNNTCDFTIPAVLGGYSYSFDPPEYYAFRKELL